MKINIKALEAIGQTVSVKQYHSSQEMMKHLNMENNILDQLEKAEIDYVCQQEPGDDE